MKQLVIVILCIVSLPIAVQQKTKVIIRQEGYQNDHGLRVIFDSKIVESKSEGDILYEVEMDIAEPVYAMVLQKNSRYTGFWIEPRHGEVTVVKDGFPATTRVKESESHKIYQSLKFVDTPEERYNNFLKYKTSSISLKYLNESFQFADLNTEQLQTLYDAVEASQKDQLDNLRAHLITRNTPTVKVDSEIYDFTGQDKDGNSFNTKDYRGKYLLLDFAATGCGPCWSGYPELVTETSKYDNLEVLTFNQDDAIETWQSIADQRDIQLDWPVLWTGETKKEVFEIYNIQGWPNFFLISPEGKVLHNWMGSGGEQLQSTLSKFVK